MPIVAKHPAPAGRRADAGPAVKLTEAPRRAPAKGPAARPVAPARVASGKLPGWGEIGGAPLARRTGRLDRTLGRVPTARFVGLVLLGAVAFTGYVGHVYATQKLYTELQTARRENLRLHLKHNRLKGALDAATSPAVVVARARALGLEEGIAYGPTIRVAPAD